MSVRQMMMGRKPAGGGVFSPLDIAWTSAYWAEDPSWTPPADGGAVSSWRDAGVDAADLAQADGARQPVYRASYTNLNGRPALEFDNDYMDASGASTKTQPVTLVAIGYINAVNNESSIFEGSSTTNRLIFRPRSNGGTQILMNAGTTRRFGTALGAEKFMLTGVFNAGSSTCDVNGTAVAVGGSIGTSSYANTRIGVDQSLGTVSYYNGALAFLGILDGTLTTQELADLESWAASHYGLTIS